MGDFRELPLPEQACDSKNVLPKKVKPKISKNMPA